jgi:predicted O-methyltransferase YrrM
MKIPLEEYLEQHTSKPTENLQKITRKTWLTTIYPRMLSGSVQGKFLQMVSFMLRPKRILEIGTFTGYSALCLADGLQPDGMLDTIEVDEELESVILENIKGAATESQIRLHIGDAMKLVLEFNDSYDLIFLDADKNRYPEYYPLLKAKLRKGGFLLADNVLWGNKVLDNQINDIETVAMRQFNSLVSSDLEVEQVLLPLRDGLMVIRKL